MTNIKNTLDELKNIINDLKTQANLTTAWDATDKANLEKRINHLLSKANPRHTNLTADLDTDLTDLENIAKIVGAEKLRTDGEISKLTQEKTQLASDLVAKDALIKQKDEQIGAKITSELVTNLTNLAKNGLKKVKKNADGTEAKDSNGNLIYEELLDTTKLTEIKTLVDELKTKGITADFTPLNNKVEEVKTAMTKEKPLPAWVGYVGLTTGLLSFCLVVYSTFKPTKEKTNE